MYCFRYKNITGEQENPYTDREIIEQNGYPGDLSQQYRSFNKPLTKSHGRVIIFAEIYPIFE